MAFGNNIHGHFKGYKGYLGTVEQVVISYYNLASSCALLQAIAVSNGNNEQYLYKAIYNYDVDEEFKAGSYQGAEPSNGQAQQGGGQGPGAARGLHVKV